MHDDVDQPEALSAHPLPWWNRFRKWLGLERNIIVLLLALLALGIGEELWSRFVPRYLEALGGGIAVVALYGTQKDLLEAVLPYPGGRLSDRFGHRQALSAFAVVAAVGYAIYFFSPNWIWFLFGTLAAAAWSNLTLPAIFSVIGDQLPREQRGIDFSVQSLWKRVPIVIAPPVGGWLIVTFGLNAGMRWGFAVNFILALLAIFIVHRLVRRSAPHCARPGAFH